MGYGCAITTNVSKILFALWDWDLFRSAHWCSREPRPVYRWRVRVRTTDDAMREFTPPRSLTESRARSTHSLPQNCGQETGNSRPPHRGQRAKRPESQQRGRNLSKEAGIPAQRRPKNATRLQVLCYDSFSAAALPRRFASTLPTCVPSGWKWAGRALVFLLAATARR